MSNEIQLGVFGKLPGYGDFIHRNLPNQVLAAWDDWLQGYMAGSNEKIGEAWLDIYLTSPIWRFVLSSGCIDQQHWAGVVLPSVDQVGRYYPFSMMIPLPAHINPMEFMAVNNQWFEYIEELALQALDSQVSIDELLLENQHQQRLMPMAYSKMGLATSGALQVDFQFSEESVSNGYAHLLDSLLTSGMASYSVWSTTGSENIQPCLFTVPGLPAINQLSAMMDGNWSHWGWSQTYQLNEYRQQQ